VELNIELQRLLQQNLFGVDVPAVEAGHRARPYPGDKVIQTRNNYNAPERYYGGAHPARCDRCKVYYIKDC